MTRRLALVLAGCLLAAACSDDPELDGTSGSARATPTPTTTAASTAPPPSAPEDEEPSAPAPAFEADTAPDEQAAIGGPLSVVAVRVARHEGYDRVVLELDGREAGQPGWRVEYDDDPRADGSGDPVEVRGSATLALLVDGVGYPFDTGVEQEAGEPALPRDLEVVEDVVLGSVFEGVYQAWIGLSAERPFRVFRLENPARVVVDIRHG